MTDAAAEMTKEDRLKTILKIASMLNNAETSKENNALLLSLYGVVSAFEDLEAHHNARMAMVVDQFGGEVRLRRDKLEKEGVVGIRLEIESGPDEIVMKSFRVDEDDIRDAVKNEKNVKVYSA